MAQDYRYDFINTETGFKSQTVIRCKTDDHAKRIAGELLAKANHYHRVEVWRGEQHLYTHPAIPNPP